MSESLFSSCDNISMTDFLLDEKSLMYFNQNEQLDLKVQLMETCIRDNQSMLSKCFRFGITRIGFVSHSLRREFWYQILIRRLKVVPETQEDAPLSMGSSVSSSVSVVASCERSLGLLEKEKKVHPDEHQAELDVKRSFGFVSDDALKKKLRVALHETIVRVLRKYPELRYYQGYHDVVSVFVMVFQEKLDVSCMHSSVDDMLAESVSSNISDSTILPDECVYLNDTFEVMFTIVEAFSLLYLRDFMMTSLDFTIDQLKVIPFLVKAEDPQLYEQLQLGSVCPFYALSSILTVFSHDLQPGSDERSPLYQIFDIVITSGSMVVPLLIFAHLIIELKEHILKKCESQADLFENRNDLIHSAIQQELQTRAGPEVWANILERTRNLVHAQMSGSSAPVCREYCWLNRYSVLKTVFEHDEEYNMDKLVDVVKREIKLSEERKTHEAVNGGKRRWWRYKLFKGPGSFWFWPVYVGVMALLLKAYMQNQSLISPTKLWTAIRTSSIGDSSPEFPMSNLLRYAGIGSISWFLSPVRSLFELRSL